MNILSLDTSTNLASLALVSDEKLLGESLFSAQKTLSARLVPEIDRLLETAGLKLDDIDLFAGAVGPGSFTGVRAGIATLQGLALASGRPCAAFSSLTLLAMNFPLAASPVCSMLDARKGEVYAAQHDCSAPGAPRELLADCVMAPENFLDLLGATSKGQVVFAGEGALRYQDLITARMGELAIFAPFPLHRGRAANGALLALEQYRNGKALDPARLLPVYIRASEAEYAKMNQQEKNRVVRHRN